MNSDQAHVHFWAKTVIYVFAEADWYKHLAMHLQTIHTHESCHHKEFQWHPTHVHVSA